MGTKKALGLPKPKANQFKKVFFLKYPKCSSLTLGGFPIFANI